jgi:hypothetical protein
MKKLIYQSISAIILATTIISCAKENNLALTNTAENAAKKEMEKGMPTSSLSALDTPYVSGSSYKGLDTPYVTGILLDTPYRAGKLLDTPYVSNINVDTPYVNKIGKGK